MSVMFCDNCQGLTDTDADPDSLYVEGRDCLCKSCRNGLEEPSEFEEGVPDAPPLGREFSPGQQAIIDAHEAQEGEEP